MNYIFRVFVTNTNPVRALQEDCSGCIFKDFDTLTEAYDFTNLMFDNDFNISLNVWKADED